MTIEKGLSAEIEMIVTEEDTAARWGSGLVPAYSTPALVALLESASVHALEGRLAPGQTSVGGRIDVRHLAATPVGMQVRARAILVEVEGAKLTFEIEAWDAVEKIGKAKHERFIVDEVKFMSRTMEKLKSM